MKKAVVYVLTSGHWVHRRNALVQSEDTRKLRKFRKKTKSRGYFFDRRAQRRFKADHQLMAA